MSYDAIKRWATSVLYLNISLLLLTTIGYKFIIITLKIK